MTQPGCLKIRDGSLGIEGTKVWARITFEFGYHEAESAQ